MVEVIYFPLCPFSRQARILLYEQKVDFDLIKEDYWKASPEFLRISPGSDLPVLIKPEYNVVGIFPFLEYVIDTYNTPLINKEIKILSEIRRLNAWFNNKFYFEVTKVMVDQKLIRFFQRSGAPSSELIRTAKMKLNLHLSYISRLLEEREYLAYMHLSISDIVAASHISVLDFFDEIMWDSFPLIKEWYSVIKSRPSFRSILMDRIPGFIPPKHYQNLDF